jgi:hypothetical protein
MSDFSNVATTVASAQAKPQQPDQAHIRKLFMLLHGAYGNPFIAKFSSGERDADGKDKGIRSAMMVWAHGLKEFTPDVVEAAAKRYTLLYPEFPPNLPQFEAVCRSMAPRKTFAEEQGLPALPAPKQTLAQVAFDAVGDGRDWARRILAGVAAGDKRSPTVVRFAKEALAHA